MLSASRNPLEREGDLEEERHTEKRREKKQKKDSKLCSTEMVNDRSTYGWVTSIEMCLQIQIQACTDVFTLTNVCIHIYTNR